jgi:Ca-activated chloride channel family protein
VTLTLRADRTLVRARAQSRRYLCATVHAPDAPARPGRVPVNLAFVIDRSGSMHGDKIARAREAVLQGIRSLRDDDRFAVVAYDDQVELVVASTPATAAARRAAARAVARIDARGSTDLAGGWRLGCEQVRSALAADAVGRTILLTDGLANHGLTDHDEIVRLCAGWRDDRVVTTTFGVGADFDETLLRRMADAGGGRFLFIESAVQIPDFVASEVGEALAVTAREAVLVVEAGPGADVASVNEFPCREEGGVSRVALGSLFGGQSLDALVEVTFPLGAPGARCDVTVRLEDADGALGGASASVRFTFAEHDENDRQPRDREVDRLVAAAYAARAERDALERNRERDFRRAGEILQRCARRIEGYAGDDAELRALVADLRAKAIQYGRDMDPVTRKSRHSFSSSTLKGRREALGQRGLLRPPEVAVVAGRGLAPRLGTVRDQLRAADPELFGDLCLEFDGGLLERPGPPLEPDEEGQLIARALVRAVPAGVYVVFVTRPFADGWFSHFHPHQRAAVVSLAGWEDGTVRAPLDAFLAYELVLHGLRLLGRAWRPERLLHEETRGCFFDACVHRPDVERKLQAGELCPACRQTLAAAGAPLDRIDRLAQAVRLLAAPSGVVH